MNSAQIANGLLSTGIIIMSFGLLRMAPLLDEVDKTLKYYVNGSAVCFIGGTTMELISTLRN